MVQLPTKQACSVPVALDYHSIPLPSGKEIDTYEVNMAGMGHRSARLSTSKWPKYVEITTIDWSKAFRYVGSKIELGVNLGYMGFCAYCKIRNAMIMYHCEVRSTFSRRFSLRFKRTIQMYPDMNISSYSSAVFALLSPDQTRTQVIASFCLCLLVPRLNANLRWLATNLSMFKLHRKFFFNLRVVWTQNTSQCKSFPHFPARRHRNCSSTWRMPSGSSELATTCADVDRWQRKSSQANLRKTCVLVWCSSEWIVSSIVRF